MVSVFYTEYKIFTGMLKVVMLSVVVPAEHPMMTYSKSKLLALLTNIRLSRKKLSRDKHSSFFCISVSDEEKTVYNIDTWAQFYTTF
jgi:hypothetical protein